MDSLFYNKYKPEPDAILNTQLASWIHSLKSTDKRNARRIRDTRINVAINTITVGSKLHRAEFIKGYSVYCSDEQSDGSEEISLTSTYSPLLGRFIGYHSRTHSLQYSASLEFCHMQHAGKLEENPIDDDLAIRLLMAEWLAYVDFYVLPELLLSKGATESAYLKRRLKELTSVDEPMIALVSCIRKLPSDTRNRMLELFDKHGPPSGIIGEALLHIDKFRTY
jgi:hypothetical protein